MLGIVFLVILCAHGLIHLLGFAKAFGLAELPQLTQAISRPWGVSWLAAGALMLIAAVMRPLAPRWWWVVGAVAVVASQVVIVASWSDARFGTLANLVVLLGGDLGMRAPGTVEPVRGVRARPRARHACPSGRDIAGSRPCCAARTGASVCASRRRGGQPRVQNFRATWTGRIRSGPDKAWMASPRINSIPSTGRAGSSS
jgi:hypothetical protein